MLVLLNVQQGYLYRVKVQQRLEFRVDPLVDRVQLFRVVSDDHLVVVESVLKDLIAVFLKAPGNLVHCSYISAHLGDLVLQVKQKLVSINALEKQLVVVDTESVVE